MTKRHLLLTSLLIQSLTFIPNEIKACGPPTIWSPSNYSLYKITEELSSSSSTHDHKIPNSASQYDNCLLWQTETDKRIPLEDIYKLVYKSTDVDIERLVQGENPIPGNRFGNYLLGDKETLNYMVLAKKCETIRSEMVDPWYYALSDDTPQQRLEVLLDEALAYKNGRLQDRYDVQIIRILFSLQQYDKVINLWKNRLHQLPEGVIRGLIYPYVMGAYIHLKDDTDDEEGMIKDLLNQYQLDPASFDGKPIAQEIQNRVHELEAGWNHRYKWSDNESNEQLARLKEVALKVGREKQVKNPARWLYTAAYITMLQNDIPKAVELANQAEQTPGDSVTMSSLKMLKAYLSASYGDDYKRSLWFNQPKSISRAVMARAMSDIVMLDAEMVRGLDTWINSSSIANHDTYDESPYEYLYCYKRLYFSGDAFRRLILDKYVYRVMNSGYHTLALQLYNIADYALWRHLHRSYGNSTYQSQSKKNQDESETSTWKGLLCLEADVYNDASSYHRYRSGFFKLTELCPADYLINYIKTIESGIPDKTTPHFSEIFDSRADQEQYFKDRSYEDLDFINDIVGTHLLREQRYQEAIRYLSKVSANFNRQSGLYRYQRDYFDPLVARKRTPTTDYKYHFAYEMSELELAIQTEHDPNHKADLMIKYATGLYNSYDRCWSLTQYYRGSGVYESLENRLLANEPLLKLKREAMTKAINMVEEALALYTNKDAIARAYQRIGRFKTVMSDYDDSMAANDIRSGCDKYIDYQVFNPSTALQPLVIRTDSSDEREYRDEI